MSSTIPIINDMYICMIRRQIDYSQLDPKIRTLVKIMNALPGIYTTGSCDGDNVPGAGWDVAFCVSSRKRGMLSLDIISSACGYEFDPLITVRGHYNGPYSEPKRLPSGGHIPTGRLMTFMLEGLKSNPEQVAAHIAIYFASIAIGER